MTLRTLIVPLLVVLAGAVAPQKDDVQGDLAKLQGKWRASSGPEGVITLTMEIDGKTLLLTYTPPFGEERTYKGEIQLDESATPRGMNWIKMTAEGKSLPDTRAIYELDGESLKVSSNGPDKDRPTEFAKAENDGPPRTLVFRRLKDKDGDKPKAQPAS